VQLHSRNALSGTEDTSVLKNSSRLALLVSILLSNSLPALAWPINLTVTSGEGEEATYKRGLLGNKRTTVKDRLGDKFETKRGIFGISKDDELGVLGNGAKFHKGILGNTETDVHTMFGDSVKYKKNVFGWRRANIDLHGMTSVMDQGFRPSIPSQNAPIASPNYTPGEGRLGRINPEPQSDSSLMPNGGVQEGFPLK
jgi:hypothetical protein